jgi:LmbE family N-acetylglucosaminyl deacetylase
MRIQNIHAHFDDFEFTAGGLFTACRERADAGFAGQVVVCTDGSAGHHLLSREETSAVRLAEQQASARIGRYDFRQLRLPDGSLPREACLQVTIPFCAAVWHAVRAFAPDYLVCPPVVSDPLSGIHVDHVAVAEAVRKIAYMINVPHAFTPEYPAEGAKPCAVPVILNSFDEYNRHTNGFDLVIDCEAAFDEVCEMSWAHRSQITEWLPWVSAPLPSPVPKDLDHWRRLRRATFTDRNHGLGIASERYCEYFTVTCWGGEPDVDRILADLPDVDHRLSRIGELRRRLGRQHP